MSRLSVQFIREGGYGAEVEISVDDDAGEWSPAVGIDGIRKLDRVRTALRRQDLAAAAQESTVFKLVPQAGDQDPKRNIGFGENSQREVE